MKVLITGASSYLGARIYFDLQNKYNVIGTYNNNRLSKKFVKLDITNKTEVNKVIIRYKPDLIIHIAANANARWCNANKQQAKLLNQLSTKYIVDASNNINSKIYFVSSFAAIKPYDIYGHTKKQSEEHIKHNKQGWMILRPSLILGYSPNTQNDRPFNRLLKNLYLNEPAIYDTSWYFQPTYIGLISEVIQNIITKNIQYKIFPLACNEIKTRYQIAKDILSPFNINVKPINNKDKTPLIKEEFKYLKNYKLTYYSYNEIIEKIIKEIKNKNIYKLT